MLACDGCNNSKCFLKQKPVLIQTYKYMEQILNLRLKIKIENKKKQQKIQCYTHLLTYINKQNKEHYSCYCIFYCSNNSIERLIKKRYEIKTPKFRVDRKKLYVAVALGTKCEIIVKKSSFLRPATKHFQFKYCACERIEKKTWRKK